MAQLKKYNVTVNNYATVLQLDDKSAKARGLTEKDLVDKPRTAAKEADKPANKSRTAAADK